MPLEPPGQLQLGRGKRFHHRRLRLAGTMIPETALARQFQQEWSARYWDLLPLGWVLRHAESLPWVRFHALPESKRYADSDSERETILLRANELGTQLLGLDTPCWVIEARVSPAEQSESLVRIGAEDDDPDSPPWFFYARMERWEARKYDELFLAIANDGPNRSIWMNRENGAVFAPYDGGFDLFPATWPEVDELKSRWPGWLSANPEGL